MPSDTYTELLVDESPAARRTSLALVLAAVLALAGNCLLNSPGQFSAKHFEDTSLLRPVVAALALDARFPTERGVELRNLFFYLGAAVLGLIAAVRLVSSDRRPRMAGDELLDFRRRAAHPYFWWGLLLLASVLSSTFAHAPEVCRGQTVVRFLHLAWWLPLAALLTPRHVRTLLAALLAALALTAAVGLWYYRIRNAAHTALSYPMGNELWLAACLLPGVFIAAGLLAGSLQPLEGDPGDSRRRFRRPAMLFGLTAFGAVLAALALTHSRSAFAGLAAGVCAVLFYATAGTARRAVLLTAVVAAIVGVNYVQNLRERGGMGQGAHSIRVRLNHAWPYALGLFMQKPVLGHGDGSYSLLAGQFARRDQIEDPRTIDFAERSWFGRTDNEYLQLLSELGLVGMTAFVAALVLTLRRALLYCDLLRSDPSLSSYRWLILSLAAAVVAMAVEQGGSPALREPGLPPIFLTVWAVLWALVRIPIKPPEPAPEERRLSNTALRFTGLAAGVAAAALGYFGVRDWQGHRANYEARLAMNLQQFSKAAELADTAAERVLDPLYQMHARIRGIAARSDDFAGRLTGSSELPPTAGDMAIAQEALGRLSILSREAPRFLHASRLKAELWWNLGIAYSRLGQRDYWRESLRQAALAWLEHRADEPFSIENVERVWQALAVVAGNWEQLGGRPEELQDLFRASDTENRLDWLRHLLRNGEIEPPILRLFMDLTRQPNFVPTLNQMFQRAAADARNPALRWEDRLAPETFRLAALAKSLSGQPQESVKLAETAVNMYRHGSPGLFPAYAAAVHELVRYDFSVDPLAHPEPNLRLLAQAQTILESPADESTPLPGRLGQTRLRLLLITGREDDAAAQLARLTLAVGSEMEVSTQDLLASACLDIARALANSPTRTEDCIRWARRAIAQSPSAPDAWGLLLQAHLRRQEDEAALEAAERLLAVTAAEDRDRAYQYLVNVEADHLGSTIWPVLREKHADFPPRPLVGPPEPPAASADTAAAEDEPPATSNTTTAPTSPG